MPVLKDHRTINAPMADEVKEHRFTYSFVKDGGAIGEYELGIAGEDVLIVGAWARVLTAAESAGSATVNWGPEDDDDRFCTIGQGAVANIDAAGDTVLPLDVSAENAVSWAPVLPYLLVSGKKLIADIATAALTAGVVQFVVQVRKP